ncbi:hypothetical protein BKA56DRAFT_565900 [Ilyonectria sp. MPI-CAGE-AT-0026]|nr:hypothetical protein BKA56DRAFT_565900 [Ilyonectria sp. MPI-CAGE-AT-0026]
MRRNLRHAALQRLYSTRKASNNSTRMLGTRATGNISRKLVGFNPTASELAQSARVLSVSVTATPPSPLGALSRSSEATR